MKVCFETFGCRLNKAEALQMEADYLARGWEVTSKHADANLIVVRGCSVTSRAQHDCEKFIAHLRRHYPNTRLQVCGCLPNASAPRPLKPSNTQTLKHSNTQPVPVRTARAFLKVQDGCTGKCTFCIVPRFRGQSRSEDFTSLLDRARRLIDAGYHEIVVTGCNLSLYCSQGKRLPDLLAALADLAPDCRIRLGSVEPGACALETVHAMAEHPSACRFLHLAVQSGSDRILRGMGRPYAAHDVDTAAQLAAKLMPGLGLGCDLIAGFPGESELDILATRELIKRLPFNHTHVFPFSRRPGTPAAKLPHQIEKDIRSTRATELADIIRAKRQTFAESFVGKTVSVVVEDEKTGRGWTGEYLACLPTLGQPQRRKSLVRFFAIKAMDGTLFGRFSK